MAILAVNGILAGCAPGTVSGVATVEIPKAIDAPEDVSYAPHPRVPANKDCCKGMNDCKGMGQCKTDRHDCKGLNDCKGLGGCKPFECPKR